MEEEEEAAREKEEEEMDPGLINIIIIIQLPPQGGFLRASAAENKSYNMERENENEEFFCILSLSIIFIGKTTSRLFI